MYAPTQEEINALIRYINGEDPDVLYTEAPKTFLRMAYDLQKKITQDVAHLTQKNADLEKKLARLMEKKEDTFLKGEFKDHEAGYQDTDIAKVVILYLKKINCRYDTEKVVHLTYLTYALFLTKGVRLFPQHPQATGRGPWLWRVSNHLEKRNEKGKMLLYEDPATDCLNELAAKDTSVFAIVKNIVEKYHDTDLREMLLRSRPQQNNSKEKNDGKWNKEIPDGEIYAWQKARL